MRLTRQSNYAIRTLVYCAVNEPGLSRVAEIARAYGISELFLFKLIKPLVENGLLQTVRGRHGGIKLGKPAADITLLDTIRLTEENFALAECFEEGADCPLIGECDLNGALREALGAFFEVLASYSIADLAAKKRSIRERLGLTTAEAVNANADGDIVDKIVAA
ncbi:Rrf2 family transcriptional regulator, iron-responsive regulator [Devosia crocina]|uniref:Rrf2 family transcriptional regulator, iron-responsive regulator n=1 Tax=Devosia crocina TaxID=429728 RepID=A0A1I7NUF9_9HYPH|nr:iron-responsive transcriptional regulator RirA [Devosia crocina]SFV38262.1 Rrf2 family transcriptional regulator, iron-responsive regulator [Devosia crocina]